MPYPDNMDWRAFDRWTMPADARPVTGRCTNCDGEKVEWLPPIKGKAYSSPGRWIECSECQAEESI